jgi:hypothetical protein
MTVVVRATPREVVAVTSPGRYLPAEQGQVLAAACFCGRRTLRAHGAQWDLDGDLVRYPLTCDEIREIDAHVARGERRIGFRVRARVERRQARIAYRIRRCLGRASR